MHYVILIYYITVVLLYTHLCEWLMVNRFLFACLSVWVSVVGISQIFKKWIFMRIWGGRGLSIRNSLLIRWWSNCVCDLCGVSIFMWLSDSIYALCLIPISLGEGLALCGRSLVTADNIVVSVRLCTYVLCLCLCLLVSTPTEGDVAALPENLNR